MTNFLQHRVLDFLLYGLAAFFCLGTIAAHVGHPSTELPQVQEAFDPRLQ